MAEETTQAMAKRRLQEADAEYTRLQQIIEEFENEKAEGRGMYEAFQDSKSPDSAYTKEEALHERAQLRKDLPASTEKQKQLKKEYDEGLEQLKTELEAVQEHEELFDQQDHYLWTSTWNGLADSGLEVKKVAPKGYPELPE
ncbi:MAG: hypothetical protein Q9159_000883 [Coniocarpon cinnabarinum]